MHVLHHDQHRMPFRFFNHQRGQSVVCALALLRRTQGEGGVAILWDRDGEKGREQAHGFVLREAITLEHPFELEELGLQCVIPRKAQYPIEMLADGMQRAILVVGAFALAR